MRPRHKAVLVTDAHGGVGREAALWLAERGFWVLAGGQDPDAMADLPRETMQGGLLETTGLDVADAAACEAALERVQALYDDLSAVVYCGGRAAFGPFEELDDFRLRALMDENLHAPAGLLRLAARRLREQRRGTLVCVSSAAGRVALPMSSAFSASRYALEGLCDALRLELGVFGVDVVLIEPGLIRDRMSAGGDAPRGPEDLFGVGEGSPYRDMATLLAGAYQELSQHAATPDEVARVIERALSDTRPRPRYAVSRRTAALLWARRVMPDRVLDSRLAKLMGLTE